MSSLLATGRNHLTGMQLPLSFLDTDYIGRFHRFASHLRASQAYAGIGIFQQEIASETVPYEALVYQLATRFPGLEVFSPEMYGSP